MSLLKLRINIKLPQLLCIVISAVQNGDCERFGGFCIDCYHTKSHIRHFELQKRQYTTTEVASCLF